MVPMKNKVLQVPQPPGQAEVPSDEPSIIFSLGDRCFAIQWVWTEVNRRPAVVIPIQKRRQRRRQRSRGSK
jgi:hypothetical protein